MEKREEIPEKMSSASARGRDLTAGLSYHSAHARSSPNAQRRSKRASPESETKQVSNQTGKTREKSIIFCNGETLLKTIIRERKDVQTRQRERGREDERVSERRCRKMMRDNSSTNV